MKMNNVSFILQEKPFRHFGKPNIYVFCVKLYIYMWIMHVWVCIPICFLFLYKLKNPEETVSTKMNSRIKLSQNN